MKSEPDDLTWPVEWEVHASRRLGGGQFWVHTDDWNSFHLFRSGGNEELWYVDQYHPERREGITGQCATLEIAIGNLRRYLAGVPVPDGDEITVIMLDGEQISAPVFHNNKGERFVHIPEKS